MNILQFAIKVAGPRFSKSLTYALMNELFSGLFGGWL
jgi:hypothetical protein